MVAGTSGGATFTASAEAVFDEVFSQYAGASAGVTTTLTASDLKLTMHMTALRRQRI